MNENAPTPAERDAVTFAKLYRAEQAEHIETRKLLEAESDRADALDAILAEAPHTCMRGAFKPDACTCWKSKLPAGALAARDAEVRRVERNRIVSLLIGPAAHLADSVRAFKAGWHDADMRGRTGDRVASGLRNVVQDRIEREAQ